MKAAGSRAREALRQTLPDSLRDATFAVLLKDDPGTKRWLVQLVGQLGGEGGMGGGAVTGSSGAPLGGHPSMP